jgi:hypothetical protein
MRFYSYTDSLNTLWVTRREKDGYDTPYFSLKQREVSVGVAQYVPELNAAVGYLQNNRNMKIAISVKPQNPTMHLGIGHKSGNNINVEKEYPSLTDLCTTHLMNSCALYVVVLV